MPQQIEQFNYCIVASATDVGRHRKANEDNCGDRQTVNGWAVTVCDGMGGHVGGAVASELAVNAILDTLTQTYYADPREAIAAAVAAAQQAILAKADQDPSLRGMGSTCVLLLVREGKVYYGHVGDSRIYLVRDNRILQLTKDHSFVQMLVDAGRLPKEEAEHHPRKNEILNALGLPDMGKPTIAEAGVETQAGDCFVLCSDGLSGMVDDDSINRTVVNRSRVSLADRASTLVAKANEAGGTDNITVALVEFPVSYGKHAGSNPSSSSERKKQNNLPGMLNAPDSNRRLLIAAACVAVLAILVFLCLGLLKSCNKGVPETEDGTDPTDTTETVRDTAVIDAIDTVKVNLGKVLYYKEEPFMVITTDSSPHATISFTTPDGVSTAYLDWDQTFDNREFSKLKYTVEDGVYKICLPEKSPRGVYTLTFNDPDGKTARQYTFNLTRLSKKKSWSSLIPQGATQATSQAASDSISNESGNGASAKQNEGNNKPQNDTASPGSEDEFIKV